MNKHYQQLLDKFKEIVMLSSIEGVLNWDTETTLPFAGVNHRSKQYQYLAQKKHSLWIDPELEKLIIYTEKDESLDEIERRNVELITREFKSRAKLSTKLVGNLSAQSKKTNEVWKKAKEKNQFNFVLPDLKKLFALNFEKANILADLKGINDPYEALVAERDPGFTIDKLTTIFNDTKSFMTKLVKKYAGLSLGTDSSFLTRDIPKDIKVKLAKEIVSFFQYQSGTDQNAKIGEVEHPLTISLGPKDVRVTVKYENFEKVIFSAAHEVGHALHRLNYLEAWNGQPVNSFSFPSIGECSSRYTENKIGKSYEFWQHFFPKFQSITQGKFNDIDLHAFYNAINKVSSSSRRMKADEVTYGLHIIIRFEIERDLFAEKIELNELPQVWNEKYNDYLGVTVKSDSEGVMQDLHWFNVYWGYFQGYHLGDIINSQIHDSMIKELTNWAQSIQNGDFKPINNYFIKNVYSKGALYDPLDLVEKVTTKSLSTKYLKNYLEKKYSKIYNI